MRKLIIMAMLFCGYSHAWEASFKITATGGAPIPIAFSNINTQSLVKSGLSTNRSFCVFNETTTRIAINTEQQTTANPSVVTHYVPASGFVCDDNAVKNLFIQSDGIAIVAGVVHGFFK